MTERLELTCIIPAYNEEESIYDTVKSVRLQSDPPDIIIVVDDGSTDRTAIEAERAGATLVLRSWGTGSKAGAQTYALPHVTTPLVMVLDADSTLQATSVSKLRVAFADPKLTAACSYVVPRYRRTIWERGRYVEYLYAFGHGKQIQNIYGSPMISSGCFSMYRTDALREVGGWSTRTLAEDMDLTWTLYRLGAKVRFIPEAVCEPIEPASLSMMNTQLKRWSNGFIQNVQVHRKGIVNLPVLRSVIAVSFWDSTISAFFYLVALPVLILLYGPLLAVGYIIDLPAIAVPVLYAGKKRGEFWQALISLPAFFVLRLVNSWQMSRALVDVIVKRKHFDVYEKGH